ncbi:MAG: hypothetical protein QOF91_3328, partial [Alphaproteobacteria bacterium]|nr:hypothetical protein [Alphaproteobacteria bacterium]
MLRPWACPVPRGIPGSQGLKGRRDRLAPRALRGRKASAGNKEKKAKRVKWVSQEFQ